MRIFDNLPILTSVILMFTSLQSGVHAQNQVSQEIMDAAQRLPAEMVMWADTVLYNGHVVTMDDDGINTNPGTIAEALALRDGFILKVGSDDEVKLFIGPDTRTMDLQGRTVLPGLIDTHAHPGPDATGLKVGQPGIHTAMQVDANAKLTTEKLGRYLSQEINNLRRPEEWVFVRLLPNPEAGVYELGNVSHWNRALESVEDRYYIEEVDKISPDFPLLMGTTGPVGKTNIPGQIFREYADGRREHLAGPELGMVPDHVDDSESDDVLMAHAVYHAEVMNGSHTGGMMNSFATNIVETASPGWKEWLTSNMLPGVDNAGVRGIMGGKETQFVRSIIEPWTREQQIQGMLQTMKRAGPWGVTSVYGLRGEPWKIDVHYELALRGTAPVRYGMESGLHRNPMPFWEGVYLHARMGPMWARLGPSPSGLQSMVWMNGINTERWDSLYPGACLGDDLPAPDEIKIREICPDPSGDDLVELVFQEGLKAHWRLAGVHLVGSEAVRSFAKLHYNAIEQGHLTKEEVRAMRPAGAHGTVISAQPDIIEMVKDLNILVPLNFNYMRMGNAWIRDYGPEIEDFILPARSYLDNGVKVYGEIHYGPIWPNLEIGVTRNVNGDTFGAHEAIDRVEALKMFTVWASEWSFAEDISGSLEPGKWADYIILEKNILDSNEVADDDLGDTVVLLTVLGDKVVYEHPSFDLEFVN